MAATIWAAARPSMASMLDEEMDQVPKSKDCVYCGEKVMATAVPPA